MQAEQQELDALRAGREAAAAAVASPPPLKAEKRVLRRGAMWRRRRRSRSRRFARAPTGLAALTEATVAAAKETAATEREKARGGIAQLEEGLRERRESKAAREAAAAEKAAAEAAAAEAAAAEAAAARGRRTRRRR